MPDVDTQLRRYLESTVERIDAQDVLTGARVTNQLQRWEVQARRPLRAALAAAVLVTVSMSAVVLGAWMLAQAGSRIGDPGPAPTASQPLAPAAWPLLLVAGGAFGVVATAFTMRKRKGGAMDTLERQEPEVQIDHLRKSNKGLMVALVVALIALAGLGIWLLFDRVIDTGVEADINALLDEYAANSNASEWEGNVNLFAASGVFIAGDGDLVRADDYVEHFEQTEEYTGDFQMEILGDPVILEDPDANRYFVALPMQIGVGVDPYFKGFSTFVLTETTDGELMIISHQWTPHNDHR